MSDRRETEVKTPRGERLRIVMTGSGTPLRDVNFAFDLVTVVLNLVVDLILRRKRSATRKVGVFAVRPFGLERCLYKQRGLSPEQAACLYGEIADDIRQGKLRWLEDPKKYHKSDDQGTV